MQWETIQVLSIEDNPGDARLIREMLSGATSLGWDLPRFELTHVTTLAAALARLDQGGIDAVLSDLDLPDSRASDTFARVRAHAPHLPIVVLTGREDEALAQQTVRAGAEDYLFKREMSGALLAHALLYAIERQQGRAALQAAHDDLERRVQARTAELAQANEQLRQEIAERKRAEEALQRSEETFAKAQEIAHLGSWRLDLKTGEAEWSDEMYRIYGVDKGFDTSLESRIKLIHPDDRALLREKLAEAKTRGKVPPFEYRAVLPDGTEKVILVDSETFLNEEGEPIEAVGVNQDITARKQVEETLRQERNKAQQYLDVVGTIIIALDPDETVSLVNQAGCRLLGYSEDQIVGQNWFDNFLPKGVRKDIRAIFAQLLAGNVETVEYVENSISTRSGEERVIAWHNVPLKDEVGNIIGTLSAGEDITARKQAEAALRESEFLLRSTVEAAPIILFTLDTNGIFQLSTGAGLQSIGLKPGEVVGLSHFEIYKDLESTNENVRRALKGESVYFVTEALGVVWDIRYSPLYDTNNNIKGMVGTAIDITARKRAEEALRRSNQELEQFASSVSHDLQIPLRAVTSYLSLVTQRCQDQIDAESAGFIRYALDEADRMREMTQGLLDLARVSTRGREFAPTDCEAVLAHVLRNLRFFIEDSGAVITHDPLPTVLADEAQLGQVFQNLISNALKFRGPEPARVHIWAARGIDEWVFAAQDHGIGLDPAQSERVFEVFQRLHTQGEYEGTGIGLAICKKIVKRHGGRIWVESEPGQGATFYFTISARGAGNHSV